MLSLYSSQQKIVTRILTSATGEQFKVTFLVGLVNGELKAQVVSVQPLKVAVQALPAPISIKKGDTPYTFVFNQVPSPYFSTEFLINSQPTRAPAF